MALTGSSIALFAAALIQPAFYVGHSGASAGSAWVMLAQGWRALPHGYLEWLANPALILSWLSVFARRSIAPLGSAILALMLILAFLLRRIVSIPTTRVTLEIVAYGPGYWLWLGSALLMVVATLPNISKFDFGRSTRPLPPPKDPP